MSRVILLLFLHEDGVEVVVHRRRQQPVVRADDLLRAAVILLTLLDLSYTCIVYYDYYSKVTLFPDPPFTVSQTPASSKSPVDGRVQQRVVIAAVLVTPISTVVVITSVLVLVML